MFRSTKAGYKQHLKTNEMTKFVEKAIEGEKVAGTASEIKEATKAQDVSAVAKFENSSMQFKEGLSDEALKARVEAAAHSANKFFGIPDIDLVEGDAIGVYRGCDIFLDKDVFEYSLDQFKDMKCLSFEDMTKVWAHECGHRILRMDFPSGWTQELGADFFSGVRSEMLGLPTSNFEKLLASTTGSATHPVGSLRVQAVQFGRDVVRGFQEKGITPTIENCKEAFAKSPFSEITYENYSSPQFAKFVDDKGRFKIKLKLDDNGKTYSQNGDLVPNNEYRLNGYTYRTDEMGRITQVDGKIQLPQEKVDRDNLPEIKDRRETDHKGHLIAHELGGADTEGNLVSMDGKLNQGEYRKMENEIKRNVEEGKDVRVNIEAEYRDDSHRPSSFNMSIDIDGEHTEKVFINESKQ